MIPSFQLVLFLALSKEMLLLATVMYRIWIP